MTCPENTMVVRTYQVCALTMFALSQNFRMIVLEHKPSIYGNKAVRQRSDLLFIETSFWFEESPCAVRTNTAGCEYQ